MIREKLNSFDWRQTAVARFGG